MFLFSQNCVCMPVHIPHSGFSRPAALAVPGSVTRTFLGNAHNSVPSLHVLQVVCGLVCTTDVAARPTLLIQACSPR